MTAMQKLFGRLRLFAIHALLATLIVTGLAATSAAAPNPSALRDAAASGVASILGDEGLENVRPIVDDATAHVVDAIHAVDSTAKTPRQILDRSQRFQLFFSHDKNIADLNLRPAQKTEIAAYVVQLLQRVRPIVESEGRRIDASLSPEQFGELERLRRETIAQVASQSTDAAPAGLDPLTLLTGGPALTPGQFVLLAELDYRSIAMKSR